MTDAVKGAPPAGKTTGITDEIVGMLELAIADKGEWYSIPLPDDGKAQGGYASTTAQIIGRRFADISTKEGRLWIRIK